MGYTVAEVAKMYGVSAHTLRYYDKEGLFPFLERTESGMRSFEENDFEWLDIIVCLKQTGLPIKEIKNYINLCQKGDSTINKRFEMFKKHKNNVEEQIKTFNKHLDKINFKIWYYSTAQKRGLDYVHRHKKYLKEVKKI
jgi:DNA-binding transcriptional MerR regulator